jgi:hypothetical protein
MRLLISSAQHRAEQLANISSTEAQSFLRAVVSRAVVGESDFAIELDREKLRHNLHGTNSHRESQTAVTKPKRWWDAQRSRSRKSCAASL